jgi:hypothetical protein
MQFMQAGRAPAMQAQLGLTCWSCEPGGASVKSCGIWAIKRVGRRRPKGVASRLRTGVYGQRWELSGAAARRVVASGGVTE